MRERESFAETIIWGILVVAGLCAVVAAISLLTVEYWL
jgi:hypothetical protein